MSSEVKRVGIAGFGVVGQRRRKFIDERADMKTVAVCDIKFEASGAFEDGLSYFRSYKDLLDQDIDILFVCLTNDIAAEVTIAGLEKGFHVFCEKPPGRNLDDIARVRIAEKKSKNLKLKYGFNHRYHDSVRDALEIIHSGEMGKVINIRGVYGKSKIINFENSWRGKRSVAGGGILLDQGIHMLDLLRLFVGEFGEIHSIVSNDHWKHDVEDNAYALMKANSGAVVMINSTATQWRHKFMMEISLERGSVTLSGILSGSKSYGAETLIVSKKSEADQGNPKEVTTSYNADNSWRDEIADFSQAIKDDTNIANGSSFDALKTMELVYRIYCSDSGWKERFSLSDKVSESLIEGADR